MKRIVQLSFLVIVSILGFTREALAQCTGTPITGFSVTGITNVTCNGGSDGVLTVTLAGGQAPFTYNLVVESGSGDIPIDSKTNTTDQFATFTNLPANVVLGGTYKITVVTSNGGTPTALCKNRIITGVDLTQPTAISAAVNTITPSCTANTGAITLNVSGGTPLGGGPPNYVYVWTGPTGIATTVEDPTNIAAGTYSVSIRDANYAGTAGSCETTISGIVVPGPPTITLGANPSVCSGATTANLTYSATTGTPDQYSINFDATAEGQGFVDVTNLALTASPIVITVPGAGATGTYNATFTVRNSTTGCSSASSAITVTINANPTITLGTNPSVCAGTTTANLTYSATTGTPTQYSINFDATAEGQGFVDVTNAALPATPIVITVPGAATSGTYNGTLTVRTAAGCVSGSSAITVTINPTPTITLGANPTVCAGATTANLTYSATTGTPDQYSINFDATAEAQGFVDVTNVVLTASPIVITVPGAAVNGTYNATLTVRNSGTSCPSAPQAISVIISSPTITLGTNPSVCSGTTTANLTYSATTGSPNQYSINFDATAEGQGFVDVTNAALTASPIVITVPGAGANGTYNATLSVRNSGTGCASTNIPITVTINANPTITLGANPSVCRGSTSTNLTYSATTGTPNQYSINFNAAAEAQGFVDVTNAVLPATPIVINVPGAGAAGTYNATLTVRNSATGCVSGSTAITVTINGNPTITLGANPSICQGTTTANLTYSATTVSPDQYSIDFNAAAEAQGFVDVTNAALPASPIVVTVPGGAATGTFSGTLRVRNSTSGCVSAPFGISVIINANPTITLGANPSVCSGTTTANLTYSATTGTPTQYSINFDAAAEGVGFVDVTNAALPATPIIITVPGAAASGTYNATLSARSAAGCVSGSSAITVTINPAPTITLGANPSVCSGATTANLTYSATTGTPTQYSINFDATAEGVGFVDVTNAALTASPIVITVPGAAVNGTYNATLSVRSAAGCVSSSQPITVTISSPSITLGANPSVCAGSTTANLTYSATTGTPDQYSINFDATAEGQGFVDVTNIALTASPIVITVPGAAATGTYNATLTVRNSGSGCVSTTSNISVTIITVPTITLGANPSVCVGTTTANLPYSATTGTPTQYSINFDATAEGVGFVDVTNAALPATPIIITVPGAAASGTYNATLTVRSAAGCVSSSSAITVTINPTPTITLGANPSVCSGATTANLTYSATTGTPTQYSINFDATAEGQGFVDVTNAALTASPIVITVPGAAVNGTYNATLSVRSAAGCVSSSQPITVTISSPSITLGANPSVCAGSTTANLTYSATTGTPDQYSINFDATAEGQGFVDVTNIALTASPIVITVPGAAVTGTYNATLTVRNSGSGCVSTTSNISVTINTVPTITLGANPSVCAGITTANLPYSATTGTPDQYSINFDATAEAQGFVDVTNAALTATPIIITVPGAAVNGIYNATLTVRNNTTGCVSSSSPITVTIGSPTITLGTNPVVCSGSTSANLTYSATTGTPNQYSINFDAAAEGQGFVDVTNAVLTASPIVITVPGGASIGTYNATLSVRNSGAGCASLGTPITVTINSNPTITLGANPSICSGSTTANLTYSATTGLPDQYSIDFNATAEGQGFVDVTNVALTASPIIITVPGAAASGTYSATLTVRNSGTGCVSSSSAISVTINATPNIVLGANPSVCSGTTTANLTYSATSGVPNQYSIDFDATAEATGFVDVTNLALTASPIVITVPGAAPSATYNAILTVRNNGTGCVSNAKSISVTINTGASITLGTNPNVCGGTTTANLTYSATTGTPTLYSIDFDATAEAQGFVDVTNAALPASPIIITVPAAATVSTTYNATLSVSNGGCVSALTPISVTVSPGADATITGVGPFCTSDPAVNLAAVTPGGTWSGTGITDVNAGTFNPLTAGAGTHTITYSVTVGACSDIETTDIIVGTQPDATITAAGPFCTNNASVTLVAATTGGTWSGTGITDAAAGTFDPATAGAGTHTITYSISIGGCSDIDTEDIIVDAAPDATITTVAPLCTSDAAITLTAVTAGGTWSGTGITDVNAGTFNPAIAGAGTHTITYSVTVGSCTDIQTIDIIVASPPDATISAAGPFCTNDASATLSAVTAGGTWSGTGITDAVAGTFDPATAGPGTHTITYSITIGGCSDVDTEDIIVDAAPDATITAVAPLCTSDAAITLTAVTAGGTWSGTGITDVNAGTFDPAIAGAGTHTITYSVTVGSCTDIQTTDITVAPPPDATITAAGPFCANDPSVTLAAVTAGGTWSGTGITDVVAGTFDPATAGPGTHTITYSISIGGCSDSDTEDIIVNPTPDATINAAGPFCVADGPVNLTAVTAGGAWSGTGITNAVAGTFNPATAGVGSHVITYTLTVGGCTDIRTRNITVSGCTGGDCSSLIISVNPIAPTCAGLDPDGSLVVTVQLFPSLGNSNFRVTATNMTTGAISFSNGPSPVTVAGLLPGQYHVKVEDLINGNICDDPGNLYALVKQSTVIATADPLSFEDVVCNGDSTGVAIINAVGTTTGSYFYSLDGNDWHSFIPGNEINTLPPNGTYTMYVGESVNDACRDTVLVTINNANPRLKAAYTITGATCGSSDGVIDIDPTPPPSGGTGGPYSFLLDGAIAPVANSFGGLTGGNHTITITDDPSGCQHDTTVLVTFPGFINASLQSASGGCSLGQFTIVFNPPFVPATYEVGYTTDINSEPTNYVTGILDGFGNIQIPNVPFGSYYVWIKSTGSQCPTRVNSSPQLIIAPYDLTFDVGCRESNGDLTLLNITGAPATPITFLIVPVVPGPTTSTGTVTPDPLSNAIITNTGLVAGDNYRIQLSQDQSLVTGCPTPVTTAFIDVPTDALDFISVNAVKSFPDQPTGSLKIQVQPSGAEPYEVWVESTGLGFQSDTVEAVTNPVIFETQFASLSVGSYSVYVEDARGCRKEVVVEVPVDGTIFIPNIFTPNNDNINDTFYVRNLPDGSKLVVTNRWGKEVYKSGNYSLSNLWDGNGAPDGVYFYRLEIKGGSTHSGWVEILRGAKP